MSDDSAAAIPLTDSGGEQRFNAIWNRRVKLILRISFVLNIVFVMGLCVIYILQKHGIVINIRTQIQHQTNLKKKLLMPEEKNEDDIVCLPCDGLGEHVNIKDTTYDVTITSKCGHKLCCLTKQKDLQRFLIKIISEIENGGEHFPKDFMEGMDWWRKTPFSAHLSSNKFSHANDPVWSPQSRSGLSFINGLDIVNDSIHVPNTRNASGVYFIYSVVTHNFSRFETIPTSFHQIVRANPYITRDGIMTVKVLHMSKYGGTQRIRNTHTNVIFRVVKLNRLDRVWVRFGSGPKNLELVHYGFFSNYFGIFKQ